MTELEEAKVNIDKQQRVCDKQGHPLRDRRARNFNGAYKGQPAGKPHPRAKRLQARQDAFDALRDNQRQGRKRPGSVKR